MCSDSNNSYMDTFIVHQISIENNTDNKLVYILLIYVTPVRIISTLMSMIKQSIQNNKIFHE